jgi:hypothetical protein
MPDLSGMEMSRSDRRRLWAKAANRCAKCREPLTRPGGGGAQEAMLGVEAHIVGARPGSARYRPLPEDVRDGYDNRIVLCPTDHALIDAQPELWTVEALQALKSSHEAMMASRTADARPGRGFEVKVPGVVELEPIMGGRQLLQIVGPAYAYRFDEEPLDDPAQREAAKDLLGSAEDWGEIYSQIGYTGQSDAAESLRECLQAACEVGLILYGALIAGDLHFEGERDHWPVAVLHLRRMEVVAQEQAGARSISLSG